MQAAPEQEVTDFDFDDSAPAAKPLICALGISHRDAHMAESWLRWASYLASQPNGSQANDTLLISGTKKITEKQWASLRASLVKSPGIFRYGGYVLEDENEKGYPISASHLFLRTMEFCEKNFPGSPVLWVEADSVPMRPGWFSEIEAEYASCGKPFLGALEAPTTMPHMPGVAVYPPNWRQLSPKLANVLSAPDIRNWGPGKGQAFDTYAADQVVPQMAVAKTIQQIWRPPQFTAATMSKIGPETALFHQCKTGKLIELIAAQGYPDYTMNIGKPSKVFGARGHFNRFKIGHESFDVAYRIPRVPGGWWSVIKPSSGIEERKLISWLQPGVLEEVDEEQLKKDADKWRAARGIGVPVRSI